MGGHTYFHPVKDTQIMGLRKWEQAFRVYAAIYTECNPRRATEIWQYIHTINTAVSAYQWDNVASYDLTFRQLMAFKPQRSWTKLYNQGWNLAMRDPIGSQGTSAGGAGQGSVVAGDGNWQNSGGKHRNWRDDCCWKYNCNKCQRPNCEYDHRCTYCGGWNHGFYNCRKRLRRSSGE